MDQVKYQQEIEYSVLRSSRPTVWLVAQPPTVKKRSAAVPARALGVNGFQGRCWLPPHAGEQDAMVRPTFVQVVDSNARPVKSPPGLGQGIRIHLLVDLNRA